MVKKSPSKDEALEALDFIINVLREHEKDLDRLIGELSNITSSVGKTGEMAEKIEKVEDRLSTLQNEIAGLVGVLSSPQKQLTDKLPVATTSLRGPPVIVRCKKWDDFKTLAKGADTVSFLLRQSESGFQADALKNGRVLTYSGDVPKDSRLLKLWLAGELEVDEKNIFEGILAIG
jgi:hypothetical protein